MNDEKALAEYRRQLAAAVLECFAAHKASRPNEHYYAFALYDCDDAIGPSDSANTEEHFERRVAKLDNKSAPDVANYRWGSAEWCGECKQMDSLHAANDAFEALKAAVGEDDWATLRMEVYAAQIDALELAVKAGGFDGVTVHFTLSDSSDATWLMIESSARCNPPKLHEAFRAGVETMCRDEYANSLIRPTDVLRRYVAKYGFRSTPNYVPPDGDDGERVETPPDPEWEAAHDLVMRRIDEKTGSKTSRRYEYLPTSPAEDTTEDAPRKLTASPDPVYRSRMILDGKFYGPFDIPAYGIEAEFDEEGECPTVTGETMPLAFDPATGERVIPLATPPTINIQQCGWFLRWTERVTDATGQIQEVKAILQPTNELRELIFDIGHALGDEKYRPFRERWPELYADQPPQEPPAPRAMEDLLIVVHNRIVGPFSIPTLRKGHYPILIKHKDEYRVRIPVRRDPATGQGLIVLSRAMDFAEEGEDDGMVLALCWTEHTPPPGDPANWDETDACYSPLTAAERAETARLWMATKYTPYATLQALQDTPRLEGQFVVGMRLFGELRFVVSLDPEQLTNFRDEMDPKDDAVFTTNLAEAVVLDHAAAVRASVDYNLALMQEPRIMHGWIGKWAYLFEPLTPADAQRLINVLAWPMASAGEALTADA
jgi:hypothetical protein